MCTCVPNDVLICLLVYTRMDFGFLCWCGMEGVYTYRVFVVECVLGN